MADGERSTSPAPQFFGGLIQLCVVWCYHEEGALKVFTAAFPDQLLELSGVKESGDRVRLREQLTVQHSIRDPEAPQRNLSDVHVRLCLCRRQFSQASRTSHGALQSSRTQLSSPVTRSSRSSLRGERRRRAANGYVGEPHAICQNVVDPSRHQFSVVERLEAAEDCRSGTSKSCRKTPGCGLRILLDRFENGGASRPRFFEVCVSLSEASESAVNSADGSGVLSQCA